MNYKDTKALRHKEEPYLLDKPSGQYRWTPHLRYTQNLAQACWKASMRNASVTPYAEEAFSVSVNYSCRSNSRNSTLIRDCDWTWL